MHQRDATAQRSIVLHLLQLVDQEHKLPIAGASNELELGIATMIDDEPRITELLLTAHPFQVCFPAFAVRWVGDHEIELTRTELIGGKS